MIHSQRCFFCHLLLTLVSMLHFVGDAGLLRWRILVKKIEQMDNPHYMQISVNTFLRHNANQQDHTLYMILDMFILQKLFFMLVSYGQKDRG